MGRRQVTAPATVLALDTSSVCIGWATFTATGELRSHGRFVLPDGLHGQKLAALQEWLIAQLDSIDPKVLVVEWPFQGGQRNAYGVLMQYCAVVRLVHWNWFGAELPETSRIPARDVKRSLGLPPSKAPKKRRHEDNKIRMIKWINEEYDLRLRYVKNDAHKRRSQDDEADAIAVGTAWFRRNEHGVG